MNPYCRGDVITVKLDPAEGDEIKKTRPCVVVSSDVVNEECPTTVIVCPITDAEHKTKKPKKLGIVFLKAGEGGLTKDSIAIPFQIRTISIERVVEKKGSLGAKRMDEICEVLALTFELD